MSRRRSLVVAALAAATSLAFTTAPVPGSELLVAGAHTVDAPLVADAGDSAYVAPGEHAVLLGTAFGGSGEYTGYAWSSNGGEVMDASNPTAVIDTTGLDGGTYEATLTVTDSEGATATDTVLFDVAGGDAGEPVDLDPVDPEQNPETVGDTEPGVFVTDSAYEWVYEIPSGLSQLDVTISWDLPSNDYDLSIVHGGEEVGYSGSAPPATTESTGIANPAEGTYTVRALRYATVADPSLTVEVVGRRATDAAGDQRPTADAGGPYEFVHGQAQVLTGTTTNATDAGWDTDLDGVVDTPGEVVTVDLPVGRHLVSLKATDAAGRERREMVTVTVGADAEHLRELAVPFTVIGIADSGINPYHAEFSAATYPDPEVLEVTRNFTRHPSEYIPGYPADAPALPVTTGQGYFPPQDQYLWSVSEDGGTATGDYVDAGQLYWIPGTKIIGAIDSGGSTGATSGADTHPILDDNGHGTGSGSVSTGNRYGYCPTCLLVLVEALDESVVAGYDWVDISSNSFGAIGGVPIGLATGPDAPTKAAAERGQLTFFSAGNGTGNAFATTPILTYGSSPNGADWVITVGATREDNQGAIVSDGYPVHISALGDGDLPSACRTGDTGQCAFGGTSAASPYTAGAFGQILTEVRDRLGDPVAGQRPGQVVAEGTPVPDSPFLSDGVLTRDELRAVGLKTALPRGDGQGPDTSYPFPWTWEGDGSVLFEGYGSAGPAHAERAVAVLFGEMELPDRSTEDSFFAQDCEFRDGIYGSYDRTGDGEADPCAEDGLATHTGTAPAENVEPSAEHFDAARSAVAAGAGTLSEPVTYFLHREPRHEPDRQPQPVMDDPSTAGDPGDVLEDSVCGEGDNEQFMSREDTDTDVGVCFDNRITSVPAAFRPKGIFTATDQLEGDLPAGSTVTATIFMQSSEPTVASLEAVLKATDREVGRSAAVQQPVHPGGWTAFELELTTDRLVAAGEQLTVNLVHAGVRSWAYGYGGDHASSVTITPATAPETGDEFGVTIDDVVAGDDGLLRASGRVAFPDLGTDPQLAGFHPQSRVVQVAVDDAAFTAPTYAAVDPAAGTWTAAVPGGEDAELHVRALRDRVPSPVASVALQPPDDGGGDGDPDDPGDDPDDGECVRPGNGRGEGRGPCGERGRPDDPGGGRGNGDVPPADRGPADGDGTVTVAGATSPISAPARGGALLLWLVAAGAVALAMVGGRRAARA